MQSLQTIVVMANPKASNYSSELQGFISSTCSGIEKTAKLRQRLADEELERFDRSRMEHEEQQRKKEQKLADMRQELDDRPF